MGEGGCEGAGLGCKGELNGEVYGMVSDGKGVRGEGEVIKGGCV